MTKALVLARVTARDVLGHPLTWIACGATGFILLVSTVLPSFTLEPEGDLKFMTDVGLAATAMGLLAVGLWPAATQLLEELASRTAMTLLAKPLSRRDYLLGRYLGILAALGVAAVLLAAAFVCAVRLTEGGVLSSRLDRWMENDPEVLVTPLSSLPPLRWRLGGAVLLGLGQAAVLCALALAFSIRLGALANLAACGALFFLGHLLEPLVRAGGWWALPLRVAVPNFFYFDVSEAVALGNPVPLRYVAGCLLYAALYSAAVLAVAAPRFERRELT